jgi:hypothetical protein
MLSLWVRSTRGRTVRSKYSRSTERSEPVVRMSRLLGFSSIWLSCRSGVDCPMDGLLGEDQETSISQLSMRQEAQCDCQLVKGPGSKLDLARPESGCEIALSLQTSTLQKKSTKWCGFHSYHSFPVEEGSLAYSFGTLHSESYLHHQLPATLRLAEDLHP